VTMNLRGIACRIERLTQQSLPAEDGPMVVCYLPENFRGPACDGPYPRVVEIGPTAKVICYLADSPSPELVAAQPGASRQGGARS